MHVYILYPRPSSRPLPPLPLGLQRPVPPVRVPERKKAA